MNKFLPFAIWLFASCSTEGPVENQIDSPVIDSIAVMKDTTVLKPKSAMFDTIPVRARTVTMQYDSIAIADIMVKTAGTSWSIIDTMTGDLNRDEYLDLLIVLRLVEKFVPDDEPRSLMIYTGNGDGSFTLAAESDAVVMCESCGGVYGDPYDGLAIKNGYFSVEHYGGSAWRWTRIITFKYNSEQETWLLHRDAGESMYLFEPDEEPTQNIWNQEHYGKMKFTEYGKNQ